MVPINKIDQEDSLDGKKKRNPVCRIVTNSIIKEQKEGTF